MISPKLFYDELNNHGVEFFTGVPDSLLKSMCAYITDNTPIERNVIAANEGGAVGLATGYHLATGKIPVVYMQNSGLGNTVNPLLSLTDKLVYNIPLLLIIGWRGEPGVKDEPQHLKQGMVTEALLDTMGIRHEVLVDEETALADQVRGTMQYIKQSGEAFALIVRNGTFAPYKLQKTEPSSFSLSRERAIQLVASSLSEHDAIVSTTGMISRELFEYREAVDQGHKQDFLTVGSMGHASQIALGIALSQPERRVFCFDGDGATIMHAGALAIIGALAPGNYYHVIFNNGAHDSVGGQPTVGLNIDIPSMAKACGYKTVASIDNEEDLVRQLGQLKQNEPPFLLEVKVKKGARPDLGRPTTTPVQNKAALMDFLSKF